MHTHVNWAQHTKTDWLLCDTKWLWYPISQGKCSLSVWRIIVFVFYILFCFTFLVSLRWKNITFYAKTVECMSLYSYTRMTTSAAWKLCACVLNMGMYCMLLALVFVLFTLFLSFLMEVMHICVQQKHLLLYNFVFIFPFRCVFSSSSLLML